ncbi:MULTISPECIES: hypothetical protein [unclassified Mycobacterium]|uniref:hypothetical protein n=1 Tax=unclassified Mycobacterium TaxID=2642494 RepID=UPI0007FF5C41|nr:MULTISPECIES: hypothetical protein [unclassified Mycobacterium]OBB65526.1 hypothetical protein A5758_17590 [Mycobacterium sp. 852014-50255_SCH5639931]OBB89538.1 hypothetical protein A5781_03130 [Mycobacterium sp. 852002-30065_SCH5024008]
MSGTARPAGHKNRATTRMLVYAAIAVGLGLVAAGPAGADPSPFSTLSCGCPETAPAGSPARGDEITRGIRAGELGWAQPTPRYSAPSRP